MFSLWKVDIIILGKQLFSIQFNDLFVYQQGITSFILHICVCILFSEAMCVVPLQVKGGIETTLEKEVLHYDYSSSYFDIFVSVLKKKKKEQQKYSFTIPPFTDVSYLSLVKGLIFSC